MRNLIDAIWPQDGSIASLLDLGCGDLWFTEGLPGVTKHVGIDAWQSQIDRALAKNSPNFTGYCMDIREFVRLQAAVSWDAVLAIDVVEHFDEEEGKYIISQMERIATKLVIIWTTLNFIQQAGIDPDGSENPYQEHKWGPTPEDFPEENGWKVDVYPEWHGARGGGIFAYKFISPAADGVAEFVNPVGLW